MDDEYELNTGIKPTDFDLPANFDLEWFSNQIKQEYSRGYQTTMNLRQEFLQEDTQFHDQRANRDRLNDYSFFSVHSAMMARTYYDKPQTTFENIGAGIVNLVANNLNYAYKTDMETPEWAKIEYQRSYDTYKYGAGTVLRDGWDAFNNRPTWTVIDPMMIIPDPDGDYVSDTYSFWWAEVERFKEEMPENYNEEWLEQLNMNQSELSMKKNEIKQHDNIQNFQDTKRYVLYHTFTYFKMPGKRGKTLFYAVYGNDRTVPLYIQPYYPELPEEKKNNFVKISKFVSRDNWKPKRDSYFGHRLAIFCLNVQNAKSLISTLRYQKAKAELYPMYVANTRMIQDRTDLDFGFNKVIFANPMEWESLDNVVKPMQKDFRADNSYLVDQSLDGQLSRVTGGMAGNLIEWQETSRRETLGTNQLQQTNADINLSLTTKIGTWFAENIAWSWYRGYVEEMKSGDDKLVQLETGLGSTYIKLKKAELITDVSFNIKVRSSFEVEKENKDTYMRLGQLLSQSATIVMSESEKKSIVREMALASGLNPKKVEMMLSITPQEQLALNENMLLAENEFVPINPNDDHLAHIRKHKDSGLDNEATQVHIDSHSQAYVDTGWDTSVMSAADPNAASLQQSMAGQSMANQFASSNGQSGWTMNQ